jgi:DNA-binding IclR family transcriptional regulator
VREAIRAELAKVRRQGFAEVVGEYMPDVFCVAAPVVDLNQQPIADQLALATTVISTRIPATRSARTVVRTGLTPGNCFS